MNLYELQKEVNEKRLYQKLAMDKIKLLKYSLEPKAVSFKEISVQGSPRKKDIIDTMHEIVELEKEIEMYDELLELYNPILNELERLLKEYNERDQLIYYYVKIKGYSAIKAGFSVCPQIGERQVQRIIKDIEERFQEESLKLLEKTFDNVGTCHSR